MDLPQQFLQYGTEISFPERTLIYRPSDPVRAQPVLYVAAGLIKVAYPVRSETFSLWLHPDSIFGLVEPLAGCPGCARRRQWNEPSATPGTWRASSLPRGFPGSSRWRPSRE